MRIGQLSAPHNPYSIMIRSSQISFFLCSLGMAIAVLGICFIPTVEAETPASILRLPSDSESTSADDHNVCTGTVPTSCPVKCFRADPVCGVDGVTYWCGCADAFCGGTKVSKLGFCEVGNGGSAPLSGQALLLVHIVWLIVLGFSVLFGLF